MQQSPFSTTAKSAPQSIRKLMAMHVTEKLWKNPLQGMNAYSHYFSIFGWLYAAMHKRNLQFVYPYLIED
jgi:hypothetical protein